MSNYNRAPRAPRSANELAERNFNLTRLLDIAIFEKRIDTKAGCFKFAIDASRRPDILKYLTPVEQTVLFDAVSKLQVVAVRTNTQSI